MLNQLALPGDVVKKSNSLARAKLHIDNALAAKIIATFIACLKADDTEFDEFYSLRAKDFISDSSGKSYDHIRKTCENLLVSYAEIPNKKGDRERFSLIPFFREINYDDGLITIQFNKNMKELLLQLKSFFTEYNLIEFLSLPSIYSQKLFEVLKSWATLPEKTIDIDELQEILNVPNSFRIDFRNFRLRVLEKAHKDITGLTSLRYEWEPVKKGRAVVAVRFIFSRRRALPVAKAKNSEAQAQGSARNNRAFQAAVACAERKGQCCTQQDNKPGVCAVCVKLGICKEIALRLE
ncbi:replication initiation protein [Desulfovibrio piger]|nr:replication initiation protein [Desulfovibrio piger]